MTRNTLWIWLLLITLLPLSPAPAATAESGGGALHLATSEAVAGYAARAAELRDVLRIGGATVFVDESVDEAEAATLVRWALDRFDTAGLELPPVTITLATDTTRCVGHAGYATVRDGVNVVKSCGSSFTLLHELAHIWARHALTDEDREAFTGFRDLDHWRNPDAAGESASEHAADVVAWALSGKTVWPQRYRDDPSTLPDAYRALTGIDPPA